MKGFVTFAIVSNTLVLALIVILEYSTGFFGLQYWTDYAFFNLLVLWGIAMVLFKFPPLTNDFSDADNRPANAAGSLVDTEVADEIDEERFEENVVLYQKFFVSGVPALLVCIASQFI
ncbi:hypothetical protein [Vibrio nigripulchritudo]|uniref:hypothetical protein n=1 Tax=Vibrio nigripulchritudo TaxID=28173 RepID=UPI002492DFA8|nr:hypothetical protein [Vibrio nigripulchritudo]BDU39460.1 membrane protein [Vibrio nigripulchritudo]BDU45180.1 membrane protein [Vibrio nigripulchritudo]